MKKNPPMDPDSTLSGCMTSLYKGLKGIYVCFLLGSILVISSCPLFDLPEEPGVVLFQDDFSSPSSGWDRYQGSTYISDYTNSSYRIAVLQENYEAWALAGLNFSDAIIEVSATSVKGPEDNAYGVICRYQNPDNYYFFLISSDGYSGIGVVYQGQRELLTGESMLPSEAILTGPLTNLIEVQCVDNTLSISVNGIEISEVKSDLLKSGDVGLITGTYDLQKTEIIFDNFSVKNP
jgi:hypothetical protein